MTLDQSCLEYPLRKRGMDHEFYPWSNIFARPDAVWPGEVRVAVALFVSLEWFPIISGNPPFKASGHMQTAYPDYRHYTSREYGTRIGLYRMLDAFAQRGIQVSIAANSAIARRYPTIIRDVMAGGHEIVAHSTDMDGTIDSSLEVDRERELIIESLDVLEDVSGIRPRGWMSIDRSQSWNTPRLLVEAGVEYMCDWVNDDLPYTFATTAGDIINLPINHELSDRQIITVQQHSADSYAEQICDAHAWLSEEKGPRVLPLQVTPYIMGLPYRMEAFEHLLDWLCDQDMTACLPGSAIVDGFKGWPQT